MGALAGLVLLAAGVALALASTGSGRAHPGRAPTTGSAPAVATTTVAVPPAPVPHAPYPVGLRVMRLVDSSRTIQLPGGGTAPRTLVTYVRYPAEGPAGGTDLRNAPAVNGAGRFPLVVFGHGFAVTPGVYAGLQQAWARAGYVVAAPAFPLENAQSPGGPDENDLTNQPADMRFVITQVLEASAAGSGPLAGLIDPGEIAVSGQSDGGDTALAVAYDSRFRDPRVGAAVILSGAEIPAEGSFAFPTGGPPLLATQGTADTINPPNMTETFFAVANPPKYLLWLQGAEHLPPYTSQQPQLSIVERVTTAFLDAYLKHDGEALHRIVRLGTVPGTATIVSQP